MVQVEREKGKALVRAMHLSEIQAAGAARAAALHKADAQLDRVARALPAALAAGLSVAEISRSAGVSRQTVYELKARYDMVGSTELAALQFLATRAPITLEGLVLGLDRPEGEVGQVVEQLLQGDLVQATVAPEEFGGDTYLGLTRAGMERLEQWWAAGDDGDGS